MKPRIGDRANALSPGESTRSSGGGKMVKAAEVQATTAKRRVRAELGLSGIVTNVNTVRSFGKATFGDMGLTETVAVLREKIAAVHANDLSGPEATLTSQALALDTIFNELARGAAANLEHNLPAAETLLRLGLKAQSQCRATLQTLAELKNPQPLAFVKQANIAQGPQLVNNAPSGDRAALTHARAGFLENPSNGLLEMHHGTWLDAGAKETAGAADPQLETLAARHRSGDSGRKGVQCPECAAARTAESPLPR